MKDTANIIPMRYASLDILKGIAILLIMSSHLFSNWGECLLGRIADSFAVPLFFFVGGFLYKERPLKDAIRKDFKRLVVPYILTALALIIWFFSLYLIRHGENEEYWLKNTSLSALWGCSPGGPGELERLGVGPTWFLLSLFWCRQFFRQIVWTGERFCIYLSLTLSLAATVFSQKMFYLPWGILQGISALIFYAIGWYAQKQLIPKWIIILSIVCWPFAIWISGIALNAAYYKYYFLSVFGAMGGTFFVYTLSKFFAQTSCWFFRNIGKILAWCGINSLLFLCIHDFEINSKIIRTLEIHSFPLPNSLRIIVSFLFVIVITIGYRLIQNHLSCSSPST